MSLIGLDVGTTGCKAIVFDRRGRILGQGAREYPFAFPRPGWAEQDAEQVWQLAWSTLAEAVRCGTLRIYFGWVLVSGALGSTCPATVVCVSNQPHRPRTACV